MKLRQVCSVVLFVLGLGAADRAFAGELAERDEFKFLARDLLLGERFQELEAMAEEYRVQQSRTSSGLWKLGLLYNGLGHAVMCGMICEEKLDAWIARYPDSPTPRLVYAGLLISKAWEIRGSGYANTVKAENWQPFYQGIALARDYLETNKAITAKIPVWYTLMATVAKAESWPSDKFDALIDEGLTRAPSYYPIYFSAIDYYAPKWHGDADAIEVFARAAVERSRATEGTGMYARIYWYASQIQYDDSLFSDSLVAWDDMKASMNDVLKAYPDQWNVNNFARFACLAGDNSKTLELINRIEGEPDPAVWEPGWFFERCKWWAKLAG